MKVNDEPLNLNKFKTGGRRIMEVLLTVIHFVFDPPIDVLMVAWSSLSGGALAVLIFELLLLSLACWWIIRRRHEVVKEVAKLAGYEMTRQFLFENEEDFVQFLQERVGYWIGKVEEAGNQLNDMKINAREADIRTRASEYTLTQAKDRLETAKKYRDLPQEHGARLSNLVEVVTQKMNIESIDLKTAEVDITLADKIPRELAEKNLVFPICQKDGALYVAMVDTRNILIIESLGELTGMRIVAKKASENDIIIAIERYYDKSANVVTDSAESTTRNSIEDRQQPPYEIEIDPEHEEAAEKADDMTLPEEKPEKVDPIASAIEKEATTPAKDEPDDSDKP